MFGARNGRRNREESLVSWPIENQERGKHGAHYPRPHSARTHGKESEAKPKAKQNIWSVSEPTALKDQNSHRFTLNESIQRPCRQEAEFAQDDKDRGDACRISKRQNRLNPSLSEDLEASSVK